MEHGDKARKARPARIMTGTIVAKRLGMTVTLIDPIEGQT